MPSSLAGMIYLLDSAITQCLESLLQNELQAHRHQFQELSRYQSQLHSPHNQVPVPLNDTHKLEFSYEALVSRLLDHIYRPCPIDPATLDEMRDLTLLYLLSLDCFENVPSKGHVDTAITLDLIKSDSAAPGAALPTMVACVVPKMDTLSFRDLKAIISEDEELQILPKYHRGATLKPYDNFTKISYEIYPPLPWLQWDDNLEGFYGKIPRYSLCASHSSDLIIEPCRDTWAALHFLKVEVLAVLEEFHPYSPLSLKRVLRAQIKYRILSKEDLRVQPVLPRRLQHPVDLPYRDVKHLPRKPPQTSSYHGRDYPSVLPQESPPSPRHSKTLPYRFSPRKRGHIHRKSIDGFPGLDGDLFAPKPPGYAYDLDVFYMGGLGSLTHQHHHHHHSDVGRGYTAPQVRHRDMLRSRVPESPWASERPHFTTPQPVDTTRPPRGSPSHAPSPKVLSPFTSALSPRPRELASYPFPTPVPTPLLKHTRPPPGFPTPPPRVVAKLEIDSDSDVSPVPSVREVPGMLPAPSSSKRARAPKPAREPLEPAASAAAAGGDDAHLAIAVPSVAEPRAILRPLAELRRMLLDASVVGDARAEIVAALGCVERAERLKRTAFRWSEETYGLASEASSLGLESGSPSGSASHDDGSGAGSVVAKPARSGKGSDGPGGSARTGVERGTQTSGSHAPAARKEASCTEVEMADYMAAAGSLRKREAMDDDDSAGEASNEDDAGGEVLGVRVRQRQGRKLRKAKRKAWRSIVKGSPVRSEK